MMRAAPEHETAAQRLASFVHDLKFSGMIEGDRDKARALLLYGLSVGVASATASLSATTASLAGRQGAANGGGATCLLDGRSLAPDWAAFANAVLLHIRMQEDAHPSGHVGVAIIPAVCGVGEAVQADGEDMLAAIYAGYEVALRIGRNHATGLSARGFRTTPIYGTIGAAAAVGKVIGLSASRITHAICLAANMSSGLRVCQAAGTEEYALHAGFAARNGILAAWLAQDGIEAAPETLEGAAGFLQAFGTKSDALVSRLFEGLGSEFETRKVTYKPQPGGQFHRSIVAGLSELAGVGADQMPERIEIHLSPFVADFPGIAEYGPFASYSAAFYSVPFTAALAWTERRVTFAGLHRFDDPALLDFAARVRIVKDEARNNYDPRIEIIFENGETLSWEKSLGEGGYDLTWSVAERMAHLLCEEVSVPATLAGEIVDTVRTLGPESPRRLIGLVASAAAQAATARHQTRREPK